MRIIGPILFLFFLSALPAIATAATPEETPLSEVAVPGEVKQVALNADGTRVAVLSDQTLSWYDKDGTLSWHVPANNVETFGASDDGALLVTGGADLRAYDHRGDRAFRLDTGYFALGVGVSPDGSCIAAGFDNRSLVLFRGDTSKDFEPAWTIETSEDVISVALTDNGSSLVACTRDGMVNVYTGDGRLLWRYDTGGSERLTCAVTHDGAYIFVGADHGKVFLLNRNGILIWEEVIGKRLPAVSISAEGSVIAAGGDEGVVLRTLQDDDHEPFGNRSVQVVALSSDGRRLAIAGQGGDIGFFSTGREEGSPGATLAPLAAPAGRVTSGSSTEPTATTHASPSILPGLAAVALLLWRRR
ncbi:hypothetical protein J2129_001968 [Methanofollis sp. W23]|uniref:WD40 repeat domain-containing protein n=1 Tax=Methanofollis sp. W23 TaxID=2817849 RepID=UPI001AE3B82E|nr:PQQ-binding-like beta-propeller repeat protein [Methanofollis sp. W23]MBP2146514.1 hypothetical protein [Methanofollis sp. W23]